MHLLLLALLQATGAGATTIAVRVAAPTEALATWTALAAPAGEEAETARRLAQLLPGWSPDEFGNLVKRIGAGAPRRVVACALDYPAYAVSQVTSDGYLRLRRVGNPQHPLWDQFHEAQRLTIHTRLGPIPGVVAVANGHFSQQHRADTAVVTMDDLWVDIGASSATEAFRSGAALLDPVTVDRPAWSFEDYAAGPAAGARAGCAVLATLSQGRVASGETIFVISQQRVFGWNTLAALLARVGQIRSLTLLDAGTAASEPVTTSPRLGGAHSAVARTVRADSVRVLQPRVRFARTLVEAVSAGDLRALLGAAAVAAGVSPVPDRWVALPLDSARALPPRRDSYGELEERWMALADLPGVAGHEQLVRTQVLAALPDWARRLAVVDSIGNVIVALGPERDSVAFLAHMDEVGFEVAALGADGYVQLRTRGGAVVSSWEGTPALLHFDPEGGRFAPPLRGVFVPRDSAARKSPGQLRAWFGLDSAALVARGVRPGLSVTGYKRAARLLGTRLTGRSSDDRSGTTALLAALGRIEPGSLTRKVIFVWTVQEEGGLNGARYFGERWGRGLRRVYSVDTFVSSDTPKESPHFAFAPLGAGAVLRALDNSSIVPRRERDRVIEVARRSAIPLQIGTTFGSTDGSAVQPWGAPNVGLSWPGRYSHGPAEILDLRDLDALVRLIAALASAP
ncbi:MAG TPA: M20/M25/M40 family metallo-hydrolase [Gemmatimonadaceae bacterium]|nr:M20/M25/M40 family metallo-hydrolase [Gemmatimonadaceae bacterium]